MPEKGCCIMRDKTYSILKKLLKNKSHLCRAELAKLTNALTTIHYLESRRYIEQGLTEDGSPDGIFVISDSGREYVMTRKAERKQFIVNFFSQFVTGLITGGTGVFVLERLIALLLSAMS